MRVSDPTDSRIAPSGRVRGGLKKEAGGDRQGHGRTFGDKSVEFETRIYMDLSIHTKSKSI